MRYQLVTEFILIETNKYEFELACQNLVTALLFTYEVRTYSSSSSMNLLTIIAIVRNSFQHEIKVTSLKLVKSAVNSVCPHNCHIIV